MYMYMYVTLYNDMTPFAGVAMWRLYYTMQSGLWRENRSKLPGYSQSGRKKRPVKSWSHVSYWTFSSPSRKPQFYI